MPINRKTLFRWLSATIGLVSLATLLARAGTTTGSLTFSNTFTGFTYADFLLGIPSTVSRSYPALETNRLRWAYDYRNSGRCGGGIMLNEFTDGVTRSKKRVAGASVQLTRGEIITTD